MTGFINFVGLFLVGTLMVLAILLGVAGVFSFLLWDIEPLSKAINWGAVRISAAFSLIVVTLGPIEGWVKDGK